jgi:hypothetical protein
MLFCFLSGIAFFKEKQIGAGTINHKGGDSAESEIFSRVAGTLQIAQQLLVKNTEILTLSQVVEVSIADFVDDLPPETIVKKPRNFFIK